MRKINEIFRDFSDFSPKKRAVGFISIVIIFLCLLRVIVQSTHRGDKVDTKKYLKELKVTEEEKRRDAILKVGLAGVKEAIPILENILENDPDFDIKKEAAFSLGRLDRERLFSKLSGGSKEVKAATVDGLMKLWLLSQNRKVNSAAIETERNINDPNEGNIDAIFDNFSTFDDATKLEILRYINDQKFEDKVVKIAENTGESFEVRKKSLEILQSIGTARIVERLSSLAQNDLNEELKKIAKETYKVIMEKTGQKTSAMSYF